MPVFVIGDLHGQFDPFVRLLQGAGIVDDRLRWSGEDAMLVLMGDFVDRGPRGVDCIELTMRLEREATARGGRVVALKGNHDLLLLAAYAFPEFHGGLGIPFTEEWLRSGGVEADLAALRPAQARWLRERPAMALMGDTLFVHGDCEIYLDLGSSVTAVDVAVNRTLLGPDFSALDRLFRGFGQHAAFEGRRGAALLEQYLGRYGADRLVHGHTPISTITNAAPESVRAARILHQGRCVNVDGGLYLGGPGFVHLLGPAAAGKAPGTRTRRERPR